MRNRLTRALGLGALISLPLLLWQPDGDPQGVLHTPQAEGLSTPVRRLTAAIDCPRHDERGDVAPDSIPAVMRQLDAAPMSQIAALAQLRSENPALEVSWRRGQDGPSFLAGQMSGPSLAAPRSIAADFLARRKAIFGLRLPEKQLVFNAARSQLEPDEDGVRHLRYDQVLRGVPVYQRSLTVHIRADGSVHAVHGRFAKGLDPQRIARKARVAAARVEPAVRRDSGVRGKFEHFTAPELVISLLGERPALCWKSEVISVRRALSRTYLINATSGKVEAMLDRAATDSQTGVGVGVWGATVPVETTRQGYVSSNGSTTLSNYKLWDRTHDAAIKTYDYNQSETRGSLCDDGNNVWFNATQAPEVSVARNMGKALYYYETVHGRKSWETDPDTASRIILGSHYQWDSGSVNNASSLGQGYFVFGDGSGSRRAWVSRDVCGHELTHGIIRSTSDLVYQDESGAANESFADVMGTFVEKRYGNESGQSNWLIAEDVTLSGNGIRDMSNPPAQGDPDHYSNFVNTSNDSGGVHTNSGILNKAAFLLTDGGTHPFSGISVTGIETYHARVVFYRAMVHYLGPNSNFHDVRVAMVAAISDKIAQHGWSNNEKLQVKLAYNACGIYGYNIDLIHYAQYYSSYRTSNGSIAFGGLLAPGRVRYFTGALEDGTPSTSNSDSRLMFWPPTGNWKYAKGSYKVTLPPIDGSLNPVLRVQVGFAQSAPWSLLAPSSSKSASSSTATAYVWVHFFPDGGGTPLRWLRQISDDGALDLLTQDLSAYAGQTGTISVGVLSGSSSVSKPVVFKELRVSYE